MRLPEFVVIGAQKSGTTWLREHLRTHPQIFMPPEELHFFDWPDRYARGAGWYASHFEAAGEDQVTGEKTPNYLFLPDHPDVPEGAARVHDLLPDARLVVLLRDPVKRALSALNHVVSRGEASPLHSPHDLLCGPRKDTVPWPIVEMGKYDGQLAAYLDLYDRDQVLVLFFQDDIVVQPAATLDRVADFLGVERDGFSRDRLNKPVNQPRPSRLSLAVKYYAPALYRPTLRLTWRFPAYYPRLSESVREEMYALYEPHNERLFELLGRRPASGWKFVPANGASGQRRASLSRHGKGNGPAPL